MVALGPAMNPEDARLVAALTMHVTSTALVSIPR